MGVAHTLSRTFFWSENILWKEDLLDNRTIVFLGGKDSIINTAEVRAYLQDTDTRYGDQVSEKKELSKVGPMMHSPGENDLLKVVWYEELDHGQIFNDALTRNRLIREILTETGKVA
jgi:hypothetical protein